MPRVIRYGARWALFILLPIVLAQWFLLPMPPPVPALRCSAISSGPSPANGIFALVSEGDVRIQRPHRLALVTGMAVASLLSPRRSAWKAVAARRPPRAGGRLLAGIRAVERQRPARHHLGVAVDPAAHHAASGRRRRDARRQRRHPLGTRALADRRGAAGGAVLPARQPRQPVRAWARRRCRWPAGQWERVPASPAAWTIFGTCPSVLTLISLTGLGLGGFRAPVDPLDATLLPGFSVCSRSYR